LHLEVRAKCYSQFMLDLSIDPIGAAVNLAAMYLAWRGYRSVEQGEKKKLPEPAGSLAMIELIGQPSLLAHLRAVSGP
jgi:hypothetical protein